MGHNCSGPGLGGGAGSGAGAGNPLLGNFTYRFLTATTVYAQFTDVNGKDLSTVQTAAAAAATNHTIASLFPSPPAGATGAYFSALEPFWWNNSAGAATPAQLYSEQGTFALGSASSSNLPALLDFDPYDLNPYVWLDCTDKARMFTAQHATTLAGTTAVAATSDLVTLLEDKGSFGLKLRATTTARPAYDSTLFGGAGGLVFDGTSDVMRDADLVNLLPKAHTAYIVFNATNFTAVRNFGGSAAGSGSVNWGYGLAITSGRPVMHRRNSADYTFAAGSEVTAATDTGMLLKCSGEEGSDGRLSGRTNTLDLGVVTGVGGATTAIEDFNFGGDGGTGYMLGSMGMMLLCPNTHRLNETKMRAWMKNRFNLA